jgi:hypothetical protein
MRIGIDFDNTIICYDGLFQAVAREKNLIPAEVAADKGSVRDYLRKIGKEDHWTKLQGLVYGKYLHMAAPYPGIIDFLRFCREKGIPVYIVSHKTRHPYSGARYDLHESAYNWLKSRGFINVFDPMIPEKNIYFELTKRAKLERIEILDCTHFVDDLPEFLAETNFPEGVSRILFDPDDRHANEIGFDRTASWYDVAQLLAGKA